MKISIEHRDGKYPSFNVKLASGPDRDPFLEIKGCRVISGQKGEFVSWPSRKQDDGKYWNHVWGSKQFTDAVLKEYHASKPATSASDDEDAPF